MPRRLTIALVALLALSVAVFAAHRVALQRLHGALAEALGPRATIGAVELGWAGLTVRDLRIAAAPGWPADEELRARRLHVRPDLASAFGGAWRVQRIEIEDARIVLLRGRDGRLRVLPALLDARRPGGTGPGDAPPPQVLIDHLSLDRVQVDLFDASLGTARTHRVQLTDLQARIDHLAVPALDQPLQLDVQAQLKGPARNGHLRLGGSLTPATRDADLQGELRGVDLVALQPYLLKVADGGVRRGTLDLRMAATVQAQKLKAPGHLTVTGLELAEGSGVLGRFAGMSRQAALAALQRQEKIELDFTLEGRLDDPSFSVNDSLAMRFATGLAEAVGVSLEGMVDGVGKVFKGLLGR